MATIGNFDAEQVAHIIDYTSKVIAAAEECGGDRWVVVRLSARKAALVTGESIALVPPYETILARKDYVGEPEFYI